MAQGAEIAKSSLGMAGQVAGMVPGIGTAVSAGLSVVSALIDPIKAAVDKGRERRNPTPKDQQDGTMVDTTAAAGGNAKGDMTGPMSGIADRKGLGVQGSQGGAAASNPVGQTLDSTVANFIIGGDDRSFYG